MPDESRSGSKRRILLVDDHPITRRGLLAIINAQDDLEVCGEAVDAAMAVKLVNRIRPDLVMADLMLKESSGLELIKQLHQEHPSLPVLALSMHSEQIYAERVLRAGARGYITKDQPSGRVLEAIRCVLARGVYVSEGMTHDILARVVGGRHQPSHDLARLTDRELEVLGWIGRGLSTRDIAERIHRSVKTVESHREAIKKKLDVGTSSELLHQAVQWVRTQQ